MHIATGIKMLEISATVMGRTDTVYPTLIWDDKTIILVDTGYPGKLPKIREAMEQAGVDFAKLNKIILTHHDIDHIGNIAAIKNELPKVEILAHAEEKPHIQGEKGILKITPEVLAQFDNPLNPLPEQQRMALKAVLTNPPKAPVDQILQDREELADCGGIIVIHTPGHTPGHICLYHKQSKTLIAGDALYLAEHQLQGPNPQQAHNPGLAIQSITKLIQYDIDQIICYHGGLFADSPNQRLAELVQG